MHLTIPLGMSADQAAPKARFAYLVERAGCWRQAVRRILRERIRTAEWLHSTIPLGALAGASRNKDVLSIRWRWELRFTFGATKKRSDAQAGGGAFQFCHPRRECHRAGVMRDQPLGQPAAGRLRHRGSVRCPRWRQYC